jgi:hypothetical protein
VHVLRIWRAPAVLDDGQPLWLCNTQTMRFGRPLTAFGLWMPVDGDAGAHRLVRDALEGFEQQESPHPRGTTPVLRVRMPPRG